MTPRAAMFLEVTAGHLPSSPNATVRRDGEPDCPARVKGADFSEGEIVGGVQEGQRKLIVFGPDIKWGEPLREGDRLLIDGADLYINTVDDQKRRVDGVLIAYEIRAGGR